MSSESPDVVLCQIESGVATLTWNRPERMNAWTPELGSRYFDRLDECARDPEVRVIVLTGAGRGFCPGADMEYLQRTSNAPRLDRPPDTRPQTYPLTIPKPIVAAVNGACAGLGLVHALLCDVRFAAAGAKFTTAFVRRGLVAEHGVSWVLPRLVGPARALDLLLSGRVFLAEEAYELGVVNRVVPAGEVLAAAQAYARDLAENCSPTSMQVIKRQVWGHLERGLEESLVETVKLMRESFTRPDFREGVASYLEKRPPRFAGVTAKTEVPTTAGPPAE